MAEDGRFSLSSLSVDKCPTAMTIKLTPELVQEVFHANSSAKCAIKFSASGGSIVVNGESYKLRCFPENQNVYDAVSRTGSRFTQVARISQKLIVQPKLSSRKKQQIKKTGEEAVAALKSRTSIRLDSAPVNSSGKKRGRPRGTISTRLKRARPTSSKSSPRGRPKQLSSPTPPPPPTPATAAGSSAAATIAAAAAEESVSWLDGGEIRHCVLVSLAVQSVRTRVLVARIKDRIARAGVRAKSKMATPAAHKAIMARLNPELTRMAVLKWPGRYHLRPKFYAHLRVEACAEFTAEQRQAVSERAATAARLLSEGSSEEDTISALSSYKLPQSKSKPKPKPAAAAASTAATLAAAASVTAAPSAAATTAVAAAATATTSPSIPQPIPAATAAVRGVSAAATLAGTAAVESPDRTEGVSGTATASVAAIPSPVVALAPSPTVPAALAPQMGSELPSQLPPAISPATTSADGGQVVAAANAEPLSGSSGSGGSGGSTDSPPLSIMTPQLTALLEQHAHALQECAAALGDGDGARHALFLRQYGAHIRLYDVLQENRSFFCSLQLQLSADPPLPATQQAQAAGQAPQQQQQVLTSQVQAYLAQRRPEIARVKRCYLQLSQSLEQLRAAAPPK